MRSDRYPKWLNWWLQYTHNHFWREYPIKFLEWKALRLGKNMNQYWENSLAEVVLFCRSCSMSFLISFWHDLWFEELIYLFPFGRQMYLKGRSFFKTCRVLLLLTPWVYNIIATILLQCFPLLFSNDCSVIFQILVIFCVCLLTHLTMKINYII